MSGYTPTGPWTNNAAPGITATFLGNVESWIQQTEGDSGAVVVSGTTAGNATLYQFFQGSLKGLLLMFNGYRNSTATEQTILLPVAITTYALYIAGAVPQCHIYSGGSVVGGSPVHTVTSLPAGTGAGGTTNNATYNGLQFGEIPAAFTALGLGSSQSFTFTAGLLMFGI